jgi:hypothetical protein
MSTYNPDCWVVIKITNTDTLLATENDEVLYKVLAGWAGGYLNGDSWRMNSGIDLVFDHDREIHFYGHSGSTYICHKEAYGLRMSTAGIYNKLKKNEQFGGQIQMMDEDTDWLALL